MDTSNSPFPTPPEDQTSSPFQKQLRRRTAQVKDTLEPRNLWWRLLDAIEAHRKLRWTLYSLAAALLLAGAAWLWAYPWWARRNAISITRQWIAGGQFDYAARTVQQALMDSPDRAEVWRLAAEVARLRGKAGDAVGYAKQAATLAPDDPVYTLEWAQDALLADQPDVAAQVLGGLPDAVMTGSSQAQRMAGEIARRRLDLTKARDHFQAALRLDGPVAIDEVPLGGILIYSRETAERQQGLKLLAKWAPDPEWGATAMRILLGDALEHGDRPAMLQWANALRVHPRCSLGDIPSCLLALSQADPAQFNDVLEILKKKHGARSDQAALLVGWLNQVGHAADAAAWVQSLPATVAGQPPMPVVAAESFRQARQWRDLAAWSERDWGREMGFLRYAYGMLAARELGDNARVAELWRTLQGEVQTVGVHALFAANTLYIWGWYDEALTLLNLAADRSDVAVTALGTMLRHYQTQRDADGQYRALRRLYTLRAQDASITNNLAYFATLTGRDAALAERLAKANHEAEPANAAYTATYAFVLLMKGDASGAMTLLHPLASQWQQKPAIAFAYGLALAATGRKDEARAPLTSLAGTDLTPREQELIRNALN
jgi:predicted Zn-dependent protease